MNITCIILNQYLYKFSLKHINEKKLRENLSHLLLKFYIIYDYQDFNQDIITDNKRRKRRKRNSNGEEIIVKLF